MNDRAAWVRVASAVLAVAVPAMGVGAAELEGRFAEQAAAAVEDVTALRRSWATALGRFAAGRRQGGNPDRAIVLTVVLSKVVMAKDVKVEVIRIDDRWVSGDAWSAGLKCVVTLHRYTPLSLEERPDGVTLRGELSISIPKRLLLLEKQDLRMDLRLDLRTTRTGIAGTYSIGSGSTEKFRPATAHLRPLDATYAFPPDYPDPPSRGQSGFDLYATAVEMEREACRRYRDILWVDAVTRNCPAAEATAYPAPLRPAFAPARPRKKGPALPTIDDAGGLGDLGMGSLPGGDLLGGADREPQQAALADHPDAKDRLAGLREIRLHLDRIRGVSERYAAGEEEALPAAQPLPQPPDEQFGPWFGFRPLPAAQGKANVLPPEAGGGGQGPKPAGAGLETSRQEWLYVDGWKVLGPRPLGPEALRSSVLPQIYYLPRATYTPDRQFIPRPTPEEKEKGTAIDPEKVFLAWQAWPVDVATGVLRPPAWWVPMASGYGHCRAGLADTCWYAATEIYSDRDRQLPVAVGADDDCQLWVNDRLVAAWPDLARRRDMESPTLFRTTFRAGRNSVLARIRQVRRARKAPNFSGFWMRICTRGGPADAAEVARRDRAVARRRQGLRPFGPEVRGWRGNWLGVEKDARPVTAWDVERNINVRWRTGLYRTISTPVITGDLLLTTMDPHYLAALDKHTGKLLWRKPLDVLELLAPEAAKQAAAIWDEHHELFRAAHPGACDPWVHPEDGDKPVKAGGKTCTYAEARKRLRDLARDWGKLARSPIEDSGHVWGYLWMSYMGQICATPITDGRCVWAWTSLGAAACFDLKGNRRWLVELPHKGTSYGGFSSPLLLDGKLILEVVLEDKRLGNLDMRPVHLLALDAATGKELWRAPVLEPAACPSPVAMRITNGREDMTVVITAGAGCSVRLDDGAGLRHSFLGGTVVRADDGKVLIPNLSVTTGYGTPVVDGDVVYHFGSGMSAATRLILIDRDTVGAQRLWTRRTDRGFEPCVCPLGGLLYANLAIVNVGGQGDGGYGVFSAATGERITRHVNVDWPLYTTRMTGRSYVPTSVAGGFVFCGDSGEGFGGKHMPQANMTVLEARPQGRIIAQNGLPPRTNSGLAFDGDRIYYRNTFGVICLGYTGDEGKAYEAEVNARMVLEDLPRRPPPVIPATDVAPEKDITPLLARQDSLWGRPGAPHSILGPVPSELMPKLLAALTGPGQRTRQCLTRAALTIDGVQVAMATYQPHPHTSARMRRRARALTIYPQGFLRLPDGEPQPKGSLLYYAIFPNDAPRTVRFLSNTPNRHVRAWFGGAALADQHRYRLQRGEYTLLAEMELVDPAAEDLCLDFRFVPSADDAQADVEAFQADLRANRHYLDRVIRLKPDSDTAEQARQVLSLLK